MILYFIDFKIEKQVSNLLKNILLYESRVYKYIRKV